MTPSLSAVYEEIMARAAEPPFGAAAAQLRGAFFTRTGDASEPHLHFASRLAAAWEDALVDGGLAESVGRTLEDASERDIAQLFARGQRGLFTLGRVGEDCFLDDPFSGAAFLLVRGDPLERSAKTTDPGFFVGRVVAADDGCTLLPGAIWLPGDATPLVPPLVEEAKRRGLASGAVLDALLRMDHAVQALSRVRPGFAFRSTGLPFPPGT